MSETKPPSSEAGQQSSADDSPPATEILRYIPIIGFGSSKEIVPLTELEGTRSYWRNLLECLRGDTLNVVPLTKDTFESFLQRAQFPPTELAGCYFQAIEDGELKRVGGISLKREAFALELNNYEGSPAQREDQLVRRLLLSQGEIAKLEVEGPLCELAIFDYPNGIPAPRDGAGAKPRGHFNYNTMSLFGRRVVPIRTPGDKLGALFPIGSTTGPLDRAERGGRPTPHKQTIFTGNIDQRTDQVLNGDPSGKKARVIVGAHPGGAGTLQEILASENPLIFERWPGDRLAVFIGSELKRQGRTYKIVPLNGGDIGALRAAIAPIHQEEAASIPWDKAVLQFPIWLTGVDISEEKTIPTASG